MKIDELIEQLECIADYEVSVAYSDTVHRAAETIRLLWEVARENRLEKYRMQIDEWRGENGTQD